MPVRPLRPEEMEPPKKAETGKTETHNISVRYGLGASNPSILSARNGVRHRLRDGVPTQDASPVPFNTVRLESLTDQISSIATPVQTVFQVRFDDISTQRYMNANVVPGTLVAYVDGSWVPTVPVTDVDSNGNFTLSVPPTSQLLISYAWQYLSDGDVDQAVDEGRQYLREFHNVTDIPDGLVPALISFAAYRALLSLQARAASLTGVRTGDAETDWSKLAQAYGDAAQSNWSAACRERELYYTQGPEALDPTVAIASAPQIDPYTPLR